jgi:acyl-homoserine lactone acylase PvdQ
VDAGSLSATAARAANTAQAGRSQMSNALLVGRKRSATGRPFAVMGPQVGYFYPQFLMELDLHGGGIDARGAAFPGVSLYVLLGRGKDYAWSATSSGSDNIDQYLEELCNTNGSPATRASTGYRYKGACRPMGSFDAGVLKGPPDRRIVFRTTVHGPVSGTVTVRGKPYAVTSRRSTRGREAMSALGFADLNTNAVRSAKDFAKVMNQVEFTFNWHYLDNRDIAFFSSGRLPKRPRTVNPSLPALGTGQYEWRGFLSRKAHPQAINPESGYIVNWNNKPARGFGASDEEQSYGSVHRVELFTGFRRKMRMHQLASIMNRGATQDLRATQVWPQIRAVLAGGPAPDARAKQAADLVTTWVGRKASRLDRDLNGSIDDPGAAVLDRAWKGLSTAVLRPVVGPAADDGGFLTLIQGRDNAPSSQGSAYGSGWYGYVEKDLRRLLGRKVKGPYSQRYCGAGNLAACRASLWAAIKQAADGLALSQGPNPAAWRSSAVTERITFRPGLLGAAGTMRWANRPTFQQVIEFRGHRKRR